jgi:hypothetical protein
MSGESAWDVVRRGGARQRPGGQAFGCLRRRRPCSGRPAALDAASSRPPSARTRKSRSPTASRVEDNSRCRPGGGPLLSACAVITGRHLRPVNEREGPDALASRRSRAVEVRDVRGGSGSGRRRVRHFPHRCAAPPVPACGRREETEPAVLRRAGGLAPSFRRRRRVEPDVWGRDHPGLRQLLAVVRDGEPPGERRAAAGPVRAGGCGVGS